MPDQRPEFGDGLSLTGHDETVYLALCRLGPATTADLAAALDADRDRTLQLLAGLHARHFVRLSESDTGVRWSAVAPDVALERALNEREQAEQRLHESITRLLDGYHRGRAQGAGLDVVEIVTGREAIAEAWTNLQAGARHEVWVLDKPPFVQGDDIDSELQALGRGVAFRGVYDHGSLLLPGRLEQVRTLMTAGESGALVAEVPFKLGIVDRRWALLPIASGAELDGALVVRPSQMLDALVHSFEDQWTKAVPIPAGSGTEPARAHAGSRPRLRSGAVELLTLLTAGMTDEAIARQLRVSPRTVQRRVSELMGELGARNRFQAGVQAARHGLL